MHDALTKVVREYNHVCSQIPLVWMARIDLDPRNAPELLNELVVTVERYDLKLWTGTLHESATYPPA